MDTCTTHSRTYAAPSPRVVLSPHARRRLVERGIDPEEVDAVVFRPFLVGASRRAGRRWLIAPSVSSRGRRRFLAVIVEQGAGVMAVLTAYPVARLPQGRLVGLGAALRERIVPVPPAAARGPASVADGALRRSRGAPGRPESAARFA